MFERGLIQIALVGGMLAVTPAAIADPPFCPPGHAKKGECSNGRDYHRESNAYEQGYRDGQRETEWRLGYRLPEHVRYDVIRDYGRYNLAPPPNGHYYAQVDGQTLLIQTATQLVVEALTRN